MNDKKIGYFIKNINDKLKARADADLKSHHLTFSQSQILVFLNQKGGQAMQKEIEDFLEVAHPTVVGIISRMEKNGYVTTWFDPQCRRNKIVQITDQARAAGADMDRTIEEQEKAMMQGLSEEEAEQLFRALSVIYRNLNKM